MSKEKKPVPNIEPTPLIRPGVFEETIKTIIANADRDRRQIEAMLEEAIDTDKTSATASLFATAPDMLSALKVINEFFKNGESVSPYTISFTDDDSVDAADHIAALIKRATGGES